MQQRFLLQVLLLAQHVSDTTMPIIRSSRVLYSGCCLWYFVLWFFKLLLWYGAEGCVRFAGCCSILQTTDSNHCIIPLSSWWWALWCPKHAEQAIRPAIKTSVASSWILFPHTDMNLRLRVTQKDIGIFIWRVLLLITQYILRHF